MAVEADDAALSADFPAAVALAEACPALVDAALADDAAAVLSLPQPRRSVPLPFQKTGVRLGRFAAFAEFPAAVAEEAALLALDDAFVSDDFAASLRPPHPGLRWQLLTLSWSRWMQKWLQIFVTLQHSFLTFSRHWHW
ncbi:hypothetical protein ECZU38_06030 [Escherichia coli]|nr:hypothetical protein ECZU38_06030 [Escherichia coli]